MNLIFYKPPESQGTVKCTIHTNGKIGFSAAAMENLELSNNKYLKIGTNKDDEEDKDLYMVVLEKEDEESFKINKAGDYLYVNTKGLFDKIGLEYIKQKVIFDIRKTEEGENIYKLTKRIKDRKKKKKE